MAKNKSSAAPAETPVVDETEVAPDETEVAPEMEATAEMTAALEGDDDMGAALTDEEEAESTPAPVAAPENTTETIVMVTADADLRVVTPREFTVFVLVKNVPRRLPYKLAMAAQIQGGMSQVRVSITDVPAETSSLTA